MDLPATTTTTETTIAVFQSNGNECVFARAFSARSVTQNLNGIYAEILNLNAKIISKTPFIIHLTMDCMQWSKNKNRKVLKNEKGRGRERERDHNTTHTCIQNANCDAENVEEKKLL